MTQRVLCLLFSSLLLPLVLLSAPPAWVRKGPFAYVANFKAGTVSVIDTSTNRVLGTIPAGNNPFCVAVNATGSRVYVTNPNDNNVSIIDTTTGSVTNVAVATPYVVTVNRSGTRVYVGQNGGNEDPHNSVTVIDASSNAVIATITVGRQPTGLAVNPAETRLYVENSDSTLSVIDTGSNAVIATVGLNATAGASTIVVNPSGTLAYIGGSDGSQVHVLDTSSNTIIGEISLNGRPGILALSPDASRLYVGEGFNANQVEVIDTTTNSIIATIRVNSDAGAIAVRSDGARAFLTLASNAVVVIDTATNTVVDTIGVCGSPTTFSSQFIGPAVVSPAGFGPPVSCGERLPKWWQVLRSQVMPR
ncbi:MAG TPA: hypothetical protein VFA76_07795 [Terriglobales bacterium]|nr:hypothetical protein [Terriglobales bacterium]